MMRFDLIALAAIDHNKSSLPNLVQKICFYNFVFAKVTGNNPKNRDKVIAFPKYSIPLQ